MKKIQILAANEKIIADLTLIKNKAFCSYTLPRARKALTKLQGRISDEEYKTIENYINNIDIDNPDIWQPEWARKGDYKQHCMYIRGEFSAYIDRLINQKKANNLSI